MLELDARLLKERLDPGTFSSHGGGRQTRPYLADDALQTAAALSVLLCQPLLLSGVPGVGKTGAAYYVAARVLGEGCDPIRLTVTSQTSGRDLLYRFDALGRFQAKESAPLRDYLRFEALGRAIAAACGADALALDSASGRPVEDPDRIWRIAGRKGGADAPLKVADLLPPGDPLNPTATTSVVLIDEIDKAPRDTPNDLLESFEAMRFAIDEIGVTIGVDAQSRRDAYPIVVCTTNAENSLPDAFLRRCVFHEIFMPTPEKLRDIIAANLQRLVGLNGAEAGAYAGAAQAAGAEISKRIVGVSRPPGTAEFVALARAFRAAGLAPDQIVKAMAAGPKIPLSVARAVLGVVVKTADDLKSALPVFVDPAALR